MRRNKREVAFSHTQYNVHFSIDSFINDLCLEKAYQAGCPRVYSM
jgi:hypothetical protein